MASRPRSVGGGEGWGITGGYVLGASFELPSLFLLASRPFIPGRFFWSISSSSSSDSKSIRVIINCLRWTKDKLTDLVSESEMSTSFLDGPTSSTQQNWYISSSKDSWENAIFSSAATGASRGTCCRRIISGGGICWTDSLTGGRSSRAKKSDLDMLIRFIWGFPALMALAYLLKNPWNRFKIQNQVDGSQLSILTHKISNRSK